MSLSWVCDCVSTGTGWKRRCVTAYSEGLSTLQPAERMGRYKYQSCDQSEWFFQNWQVTCWIKAERSWAT